MRFRGLNISMDAIEELMGPLEEEASGFSQNAMQTDLGSTLLEAGSLLTLRRASKLQEHLPPPKARHHSLPLVKLRNVSKFSGF